ncbi:hypothetical protein BASA81_001978 [Batrachochytrium salamandrivorans]|nr:hypothetical protein BASA81_001978 [Batrachochytrium salamandrivorans]
MSNELVALLHGYDPGNPEQDFEFLLAQFPPNYHSFSVLALSLSTSLPALQLLLQLDFVLVVETCTDELELERWIGFVPERMKFSQANRINWFQRFCNASVQCGRVRLICKLLRLGQCIPLAQANGWGSKLFLQVMTAEPHLQQRDSLLLAMLSNNHHSILPQLLCEVPNVLDWIKHIVLNRNCLAPEILFRLLRSVQVNVDFLEQIVLVWSDVDFIARCTLIRHGQVSGTIRYCFDKLVGQDKDGKITAILLQGIQHHLSCNIAEKRVLGMIVAEEFTNVFLCDANRLEFGDDRMGFIDEYAPRMRMMTVVIPTTTTPSTKVGNGDEDIPLSEPWPINPFSYRVFESDGEEEEEDDVCSLEAFDISEDVTGLVIVPKQLGQIPSLLGSDSLDSVQAALENLPLIVRANSKRADTKRRAAKLLFTLLELDNKFALTEFELLRSRGIIALLVCCPKETGPGLAKAIYSRNLTLGTKMVALECLAQAVKSLADGGFEEEASRSLPPQRPVVMLGTVTKRSVKLSTTLPLPTENKLAPLAWQSFFSPLCSRLVDFEREPLLLCKVIACLALILERSKHAGGEARRMAQEFVRVLPWLKHRTEGEVQRALLYSLAAVASVALDLVAQDWLKWVQYVGEESQDEPSRNMARRIAPMLANGVWI